MFGFFGFLLRMISESFENLGGEFVKLLEHFGKQHLLKSCLEKLHSQVINQPVLVMDYTHKHVWLTLQGHSHFSHACCSHYGTAIA